MRRWLAALFLLPACNVDVDVARTPAPVVVDSGLSCAPGMINLGEFCIDAMEVTKAQYAAFLASKPGTSLDARCAWSSKHEPRESPDPPASCSADEADLTKNPDHPVVCIDWCDALAYCAWAGKRLCGAIGGGPEQPFDDLSVANDVKKSQWYAACAGGGATPREYPYGNSFEAGRCSDLQAGGATKPVGSMPGCHGPPGTVQAAVFDLSGNVYEWTDNCQASAGDQSNLSCRARGGFYRTEDLTDAGTFAWMKCAVVVPYDLTKPRNYFDDHIGIRCCSP